MFLAFSCIGYALPFILCAIICCCLPCIISIMGFREDINHGRGATQESINALPTYKFKTKRRKNRGDKEINLDNQGIGGILAAGTDKERIVSAEDAVSFFFTSVDVHILDASAKKSVALTRKIIN